MTDKEYQSFKQMPIEDLTFHAAGFGTGSSLEKAKLVHSERLIELQHKLNKENIELQYSLNEKIVKKQLTLMRQSTIITAASTLIAALAGAYLAYTLTQIQKPLQIKLDSAQLVQLQKVSSNAASHYGKKIETVPLNNSPKGEKTK